MTRFKMVGDGWEYLPRWLDFACCDCDLVHDIKIRARFVKGKPRLEWKVERNEEATAALRRHRKAKHAAGRSKR